MMRRVVVVGEMPKRRYASDIYFSGPVSSYPQMN